MYNKGEVLIVKKDIEDINTSSIKKGTKYVFNIISLNIEGVVSYHLKKFKDNTKGILISKEELNKYFYTLQEHRKSIIDDLWEY